MAIPPGHSDGQSLLVAAIPSLRRLTIQNLYLEPKRMKAPGEKPEPSIHALPSSIKG